MALSGNELRDHIASLLRMKFTSVSVEHKLATTTADVLYIDDTNELYPQTIAVEAKNWSRSLTSDKIAKIDNLYRPSLSSGEIDFLLIVGRNPLGASPAQSLRRISKVRYCTVDEFDSSLMNFKGILSYNINSFSHHDAAKNFILARQRHSDKSMDDIVNNWLLSDNIALIIFGGYGLGKTTYSLYLSKMLSEAYVSGNFKRIPIRISLGGMYTKQDLMALICSSLSGGEAGAVVPNFSYHLFLSMNQNGKFVLILDGFDEMRHAMDLADFVYTFEQMQPLFAGKSKVIVLGRPDSFLSNEEEDRVLSSLFDIGSDKKLQKAELAFFSKAEIRVYLENFLKNRECPLSSEQLSNYSRMVGSLPDADDNILSRPVQLRMFTAIMEECLTGNVALTRYQIYNRFIYRFISRESQKGARSAAGLGSGFDSLRAERAAFMQDVAWWVLNTKKENRFVADEIPLQIVPSQIKTKRSRDASIRESLVGSIIEPISKSGVLDRKAKRYYFFPHKSYIEFLVTEYFMRVRFSATMFAEFLKIANREILSFIEEREACELSDEMSGISKFREGLKYVHGKVDSAVIELCAKDTKIPEELSKKEEFNHPSQIYAHFIYLKNEQKYALDYIFNKLAVVRTVEATAAVISCLSSEISSPALKDAVRRLFILCFTSTYLKAKSSGDGDITMYIYDKTALLARIMLECFHFDDRNSCFRFSAAKLAVVAEEASRATFFVTLGTNSNNTQVAISLKYIREALQDTWVQQFNNAISEARKRNGRLPIFLRGDAGN